MASFTSSLDCVSGADYPGSLIDQSSLSNSLNDASPAGSVGTSTFISDGSQFSTKCFICNDKNPMTLNCLHTFCTNCLECNQEDLNNIVCPRCSQETTLGSRGLADLMLDGLTCNIEIQNAAGFCTSCKSQTFSAISWCVDCKSLLCKNCTLAHQCMNFFEGHRVHSLSQENGDHDLKTGLGLSTGEKDQGCPHHKTSILVYFCSTCNVPVCQECALVNHQSPAHDCEHISKAGPKQIKLMTQAIQQIKNKATDLRIIMKTLEHSSQKLQLEYQKAQNGINDTFQVYRFMLEERKQDILKELESVFNVKQMGLNVFRERSQDTIDKMDKVCDVFERLVNSSSVGECLLFKKFIDSRLQALTCDTPDPAVQQRGDLEYVSNYEAIRDEEQTTCGYVQSTAGVVDINKQPPIAKPSNGSVHMNGTYTVDGCMDGGSLHTSFNGTGFNGTLNGVLERQYSNGLSLSGSSLQYESNILKQFRSDCNLGPFFTSISDWSPKGGSIHPSEILSSGGNDIFQSGDNDYMNTLATQVTPMLDIGSTYMSSTSISPPQHQIVRQKMVYQFRFGGFGDLVGEIAEAGGVAVNAQNDIIVADTNNHRIQIFDNEGRFQFQFGGQGQLKFPNRVAVDKTSGDIIVTERSPAHQIQIYSQYGQFIRTIGANILQQPRGLTVDNKGLIIVVECKIMRVVIFDQAGNVLHIFDCARHLQFPNNVTVNDRQEILISDNRAHCVKVFNYEGVYLRQIGCEGVINFPIGVEINSAEEIVIVDNHNSFNVSIFSPDGQLVSALQSRGTHARCLDVALMNDGSIVLACSDFYLYIYRYIQ